MRICRLEECKAPFEPGPWAFRQEFCCQKHHDRYWYLQRKDEGEFQDRNERRREIRAHEENRKKVLEESGHDIGPWDFGTPEQRAAAKAKVKEMFPYKGPTLRRMNGRAVDGQVSETPTDLLCGEQSHD